MLTTQRAAPPLAVYSNIFDYPPLWLFLFFINHIIPRLQDAVRRSVAVSVYQQFWQSFLFLFFYKSVCALPGAVCIQAVFWPPTVGTYILYTVQWLDSLLFSFSFFKYHFTWITLWLHKQFWFFDFFLFFKSTFPQSVARPCAALGPHKQYWFFFFSFFF